MYVKIETSSYKYSNKHKMKSIFFSKMGTHTH